MESDSSSPAYDSSIESGEPGDNEKSRATEKPVTVLSMKSVTSIRPGKPADSKVSLGRSSLANCPQQDVTEERKENGLTDRIEQRAEETGGRGVLHFLVARLWKREKDAVLFPQNSATSMTSTTTMTSNTPSAATDVVKSIYLVNLRPNDYEHYLKLGLTLRFTKSCDEEEYSDKLCGSYKYIAPMIGMMYTLSTFLINIIVGTIVMSKNSIRLLIFWLANLMVNLFLCMYLLKFGRATFKWTTFRAEISCIICLLINPLMITLTSIIFHTDFLRSGEQESGLTEGAYAQSIDFWILEWGSIFLSIVFIDLWQCSRTRFAIHGHIVLTICCLISRCAWCWRMPSKLASVNAQGLPSHATVIWIAAVQSLALIGNIWLMYCSRYLEELRERLVFVANLCNRRVLRKLRTNEKKERKQMEGHGMSLSERVSQPLKRASLEVLAMAFAEEDCGDIYLLELNEQLNACISLISANADQLFELNKPASKSALTTDQEAPVDYLPGANLIDGAILLSGASEYNEFLGDQLGAGFPGDVDSITSPTYLTLVGKELDIGCIKLFKERKNFLLETTFYLMKDLTCTGGVDNQILLRYIYLVQQRHWNNPYHNRGHVAMVVHMTKLYSDAFNLPKDDLTSFAALLSALGHDVAHGGRNSHFIVTDGIERHNNLLVDLCGTSNVVEGLHAHMTFRLTQVEGCNIFQKLRESQYRLLRRYVIDMILATNMAAHFEILGALRLRHESGVADWLYNIDDQLLLRKIILKAADLAHACVPWTEHFEWSTRIVNEFYQQGDLEVALKYTISPLCDRSGASNWSNSQLSYVTEVVLPLYTQLNQLPHQRVFADALLSISINQDQWKKTQNFRQLSEQIAPYKYEDALLYASLLAPSTVLDKQPQAAPAFIASQRCSPNYLETNHQSPDSEGVSSSDGEEYDDEDDSESSEIDQHSEDADGGADPLSEDVESSTDSVEY